MSIASFADLALSPRLQQTLTELGYAAPTPVQVSAIPVILAGRDLMAGAQTGTGKTAAFVLPLLEQLLQHPTSDARPIRALVLVPTRELAVQVHESVTRYAKGTDLTSTLVYGGVSIAAQVEALKNGVDILIATPGRLLDHLRQGALSLAALRHLVFDEADRMLDMGFMDEIKALLKQIPADRQTLLFSATCDDNLFALSKVLLRDPALIEVAPRNTTAAEVEQRVYTVDGDRKLALVEHMLKVKGWAPALIFSRTRQGADKLAQQLGKAGINALAFHGDLSQGAREKVLLEFRAGTLQALVATDVAARGLDITDLNYVINMEFPFVAEDYVHRIGRTGRAGNKGLAITLFSPEDAPLLEKVEAVLDTRLPQQWFPGFEPDLTRFEPEPRRSSSKAAQKQRARKQALAGNKGGKGRR
ncbi:TPA: DEAD/DEAH box helicase [Aeromonas hydrophila]|uniref:DEAD/DEAH box helicase n=1 Tax=Aeromonas hydrophila TaxID=644 RepID=UPI000FD163FC|nr:DEAD/DEAH box helicase [Aeromonas hydrophila]AZU47055.1 ATP-dependent RNA helicase RhlE [Aeromonas hydrophila]MCV3293036.1 DEAD/DEAH box helicase [Aeromonas hydrophila]QBX72983.1 DEAD/DEAH box helicase [Aeromonas hydrophila]QBX77683.1 DEAD/DEAH box helicase [Aeromonas hydrophila]WDA23801.1 DEAD/DEAH box helicase [Aeromonas hydrophila]